MSALAEMTAASARLASVVAGRRPGKTNAAARAHGIKLDAHRCLDHITRALLFTESLCSVCGRRLMTPITKESR